MPKGIHVYACEDHNLSEICRQRNLNWKKMKHSIILDFWNNGERSATTISPTTKISLRTVKYNIAKIRQQGRVENRSPSGHLPSMITRHLVKNR